MEHLWITKAKTCTFSDNLTSGSFYPIFIPNFAQMSDKKELVIVGAGGFARELICLGQQILQKYPGVFQLKGLIAGTKSSSSLLGLPILGDDNWAMQQLDRNTLFVIGIGSPLLRKRVAQQYEAAGFRAGQLIHPSVALHESVERSPGLVMCAGVQVTVDIKLGKHVHLNLNSTVGHDCQVGDYATISPGVNLSGQVILKEGVMIGTGASVLPGVQIGQGAILGAGAVATQNLLPGLTYVGIPARPLPASHNGGSPPPKIA